MAGENDIKGLFIYSIDEEIPGNAVIEIEKKKGWYRALSTPWVSSFLFIGKEEILCLIHIMIYYLLDTVLI